MYVHVLYVGHNVVSEIPAMVTRPGVLVLLQLHTTITWAECSEIIVSNYILLTLTSEHSALLQTHVISMREFTSEENSTQYFLIKLIMFQAFSQDDLFDGH